MRGFKFVMAAALVLAHVTVSMSALAWAGRIDPALEGALQTAGPSARIPVIISLSGKVDPHGIGGRDRAERRRNLVTALKEKARAAHPPVEAFLRKEGASGRVTSLWGTNALWAELTPRQIERAAGLPEVELIKLDALLRVPETAVTTAGQSEWNISAVRAPDMWGMGQTGEGAVVALMDTGVDYLHPDLSAGWRGGANSWFDPYGEHAAPYDADGHGTMVAGIMVGGSAGGTAIGMAPGARWIAVKIFNDLGYATLSAIHLGFQWLLDPDGDPATDDAPDVVNNSWGFQDDSGTCYTYFEQDVGNLRAAGTAVVFAAGNTGPSGGTSTSPANYPGSFSVGSVDGSLNVSHFSSRGPSACDGGLFPEVAAPGENVMTSDLTFGGTHSYSYAYGYGTSFAAPHVAGAIALLRGAVPGAEVSALESAIKESALDRGEYGPDNAYGYGVLDVAGAYAILAAGGQQCTDSDGDGFYAQAGCGAAAADCNDADPAVYPGAPEVKLDGLDQDCNGYDLTINILKAAHAERLDTLRVEASSGLMEAASLYLQGFGPMRWDRKRSIWNLSVRRSGNPARVTVTGPEGSESAEVTGR